LLISGAVAFSKRGGGFRAEPIRVVLRLYSRAVVRCCDRHGRPRL